MKTCTKCGKAKPVAEFPADRRLRSGRAAACKTCRCSAAVEWQRRNPEKRAAVMARWRKNNPEKEREQGRKWERENPEKLKAKVSRRDKAKLAANMLRWQKAHPDKVCALSAKRRAAKLRATPIWANQCFVEDVYRKAALFTKRDGTPWHVDHIVPLKSTLVCGLHVEHNLRVIPAVENMKKHNSYWPDMPEQGARP